MAPIVLFDDGTHKNVLLDDFSTGGAVQANQHLVIHNRTGMILDPGGHKVYSKVLGETTSVLAGGTLEHIFLSHQDPDIVAAVNGWLMTTDATAWSSELWIRFIPHFGVDALVANRLHGIPDAGMTFDLGGAKLYALPAHFLHSCGNFHLYDPTSKILYSGDLGASLEMGYREVTDFDAHIPYMLGFHRRYMASNKVLSAWVRMVRQLDIEIIAPQHGALFRGREMVSRFLDFCEGLECGIDLMLDLFRAPEME
ncbi:CDP-abequose synthase [Minicystis rosea]|nr:CDP-abequose synthase [Minicystis rosea]